MTEYDYLDIGSTPAEEPCAQVGSGNYSELSRLECLVFEQMILRHFPMPTDILVNVVVKSYPHDFGLYYSVAVKYDVNDPKAYDYALMVEGDCPTQWDDEAKKILAKFKNKVAL